MKFEITATGASITESVSATRLLGLGLVVGFPMTLVYELNRGQSPHWFVLLIFTLAVVAGLWLLLLAPAVKLDLDQDEDRLTVIRTSLRGKETQHFALSAIVSAEPIEMPSGEGRPAWILEIRFRDNQTLKLFRHGTDGLGKMQEAARLVRSMAKLGS